MKIRVIVSVIALLVLGACGDQSEKSTEDPKILSARTNI